MYTKSNHFEIYYVTQQRTVYVRPFIKQLFELTWDLALFCVRDNILQLEHPSSWRAVPEGKRGSIKAVTRKHYEQTKKKCEMKKKKRSPPAVFFIKKPFNIIYVTV